MLINLILAFGISSTLAAPPKTLTPADFETILSNDVRVQFKRLSGEPVIRYDVRDTPFYVLFNPRDKWILFQGIMLGNLSLEKINRWNDESRFSRVYIERDRIFLEVSASFATGISRESVASHYRLLLTEWKGFQQFLNGDRP